ncbi:MAG: hypothetical protein WC846_05020 [Candidatus Gracilibacteria bacterium]|jgi:hypothetical protein
MKKTLSALAILGIFISLFACTSNQVEDQETVTIDNFGEEIIFTPSEKDWCGEDCLIYPENGNMYIRVPESGDPIFYPEGTGRDENLDNVDANNEPEISEEEQQMIKDIIDANKTVETFVFGGVDYELDYPSTWSHVEETYDSGGIYTQFYDENQEKTMMVDCDWQGGMETEKLKSDSRTFEKQGELAKVTYEIYGTQNNIGNGHIATSLKEWSEEKSEDYYCHIFLKPSVAEDGLVEEIFLSIQ